MDISPALHCKQFFYPKEAGETITRAIHCCILGKTQPYYHRCGYAGSRFRPQHARTGEWRQYVSYGCEPAGAGGS